MIKNISNKLNFDNEYLILIITSILIIFLFFIIKKLVPKIVKFDKSKRQQFFIIRNAKIFLSLIEILFVFLLWDEYLQNILTLISVISAGITIALRDLILNLFCGIFIKIKKPFKIEDRIEINGTKGDVININVLNFEILEVDINDFNGQSTGTIISIPNSTVFAYPVKNYTKAFKYIWNELIVKVTLDSDLKQNKKALYNIINNIDIIKNIPNKMQNQIDKIEDEYRIYYNNYNPIIYTKIVNNYVELRIRYLIHPKKARYVESIIWNKIYLAEQKKEIILFTE